MLYFCTAGRGTEVFLEEEIKLRYRAEQVHRVDGKVFFDVDGPPSDLLQLKCAERLFIQVVYQPGFHFDSLKDVQSLVNLLDVVKNWDDILSSWRDLASFRQQHPHCSLTGSKEMGEPPCKKSRAEELTCTEKDKGLYNETDIEERIQESEDVTFRVSCRLSVRQGRFCNPQRLARTIGQMLCRKLGWKVDLRKPLLEVCVHLGNQGLTVGLPMTRSPLSNRSYLKEVGLRTGVAWIMAQLANIKEGDTILDPMCGAATILLEARHSWPTASYIGIDNCMEQLERAKVNIAFSRISQHVSLVQGCAQGLPLEDASVDAVVCDMPFGSKHLTVEKVRQLYPQVLQEMDRVLRPGGRVVLLTSAGLKNNLLREVEQLSNVIISEMPVSRHSDNPGSTVHGFEEPIESPGLVSPSGSPSGRLVNLEVPAPQTSSVQTVSGRSQICQEIANIRPLKRSFVRKESDPGKERLDILNTIGNTGSHGDEGCDESQGNLELSSTSQEGSGGLPRWSLTLTHYVKLGETHAYICAFTKR